MAGWLAGLAALAVCLRLLRCRPRRQRVLPATSTDCLPEGLPPPQVTRGVMYAREEAEGKRLRHPFDTITGEAAELLPAPSARPCCARLRARCPRLRLLAPRSTL